MIQLDFILIGILIHRPHLSEFETCELRVWVECTRIVRSCNPLASPTDHPPQWRFVEAAYSTAGEYGLGYALVLDQN